MCPLVGLIEEGDEEFFDFVSGPRGFAEKFEGGFHRGVVGEAADSDAVREFVPAVFLDEAGDDGFQGVAVEGIVRMIVHEVVRSGDGDDLGILEGVFRDEFVFGGAVEGSLAHLGEAKIGEDGEGYFYGGELAGEDFFVGDV